MFIKLFAIALPIFFIIDMVWLGLVAKSFYVRQIGDLMRPDIQWPAAIIFYVLFVAGLVLFVLLPAVTQGSWVAALSMGALFGFIAYATYDLTNLATLKNWPLTVALVDMAWGAVLAGAVSTATYFIAGAFGI